MDFIKLIKAIDNIEKECKEQISLSFRINKQDLIINLKTSDFKWKD